MVQPHHVLISAMELLTAASSHCPHEMELGQFPTHCFWRSLVEVDVFLACLGFAHGPLSQVVWLHGKLLIVDGCSLRQAGSC